MSRNLDTSMAAALPNGVIQPAVLVQLTLKSGVVYVWSGVGDLVYGGNTYKGVGNFGKLGPILEGDTVHADGTTVTLSGIGFSPFAQPDPGAGITPPDPPVTVPSGQSVAWAYATSVISDSSGTGVVSGVTLHGGAVAVFGSYPPVTTADRGDAKLEWSGFKLPPLPADAVIENIYPTVVISEFSVVESSYIPFNPDGYTGVGTFHAGPIGEDALAAQHVAIELDYSLDGAVFSDSVVASFIGCAVYYTGSGDIPPNTWIQEALGDVQIGAPAKIWFGLRANGAFIGAPYLIFAGMVDKPTVEISDKTSSITLALESKLANLQRPTQRRYTAADQHLAYPDDIGFNWVEILNDIALRWG